MAFDTHHIQRCCTVVICTPYKHIFVYVEMILEYGKMTFSHQDMADHLRSSGTDEIIAEGGNNVVSVNHPGNPNAVRFLLDFQTPELEYDLVHYKCMSETTSLEGLRNSI